jgi:hypothetical protein
MTAKQESEKLMNAILSLAQNLLRDYGEFYPYGGYMKPDGEIVHIGVKDEETDHPKSNDLLHLLRDSFSAMAKAGECKVTAIVFDVRVNLPDTDKKGDAIQICLDHVDGYSVEVFFPYEIIESGRVIYGAIFANKGKSEIFGNS